jgi:hypothetical protein
MDSAVTIEVGSGSQGGMMVCIANIPIAPTPTDVILEPQEVSVPQQIIGDSEIQQDKEAESSGSVSETPRDDNAGLSNEKPSQFVPAEHFLTPSQTLKYDAPFSAQDAIRYMRASEECIFSSDVPTDIVATVCKQHFAATDLICTGYGLNGAEATSVEHIISAANQWRSVFTDAHMQITSAQSRLYGHGPQCCKYGYLVSVSWRFKGTCTMMMTDQQRAVEGNADANGAEVARKAFPVELEGVTLSRVRMSDRLVFKSQRFWNAADLLAQVGQPVNFADIFSKIVVEPQVGTVTASPAPSSELHSSTRSSWQSLRQPPDPVGNEAPKSLTMVLGEWMKSRQAERAKRREQKQAVHTMRDGEPSRSHFRSMISSSFRRRTRSGPSTPRPRICPEAASADLVLGAPPATEGGVTRL